MKRLSTLLALISLTGFYALSQTSRTSNIQQYLGEAKPTWFGNSRPSDCDTFNNLCADDELVVYQATCTAGVSGGYVCGQNCYGDKSKADIFHLAGQSGNTQITGMLFFFGAGQAANTTDELNVRVWDHSGTFADGGDNAPGAVLTSQALKYNTVKSDVTNGSLTYVQFSNPVDFPTDSIFYAGIDFTYIAGDTVAIVNVSDRNSTVSSCPGVNTSVDKFSDNTWHHFTDADDWGIATSQMIFPILCSNNCAITITPSSPDVCNHKSVDLSASGGGPFTWSPAASLNVTTGANVISKPNVTTTYTVTGDSSSCSTTVTVTVNPNPKAKISMGSCTNGTVPLIRIGAPSNGVKFQWLKDNIIIAGATNSTYYATTSGEYKVNVGIIATHCSHLSPGVNVVINCRIADVTSSFEADAFPNPFAKSVTVNIVSVSAEAANIKLMDYSGRIIRQYKNVDASAPFEIDEDLAPGVYFVNVSQGLNERMMKVVKE